MLKLFLDLHVILIFFIVYKLCMRACSHTRFQNTFFWFDTLRLQFVPLSMFLLAIELMYDFQFTSTSHKQLQLHGVLNKRERRRQQHTNTLALR